MNFKEDRYVEILNKVDFGTWPIKVPENIYPLEDVYVEYVSSR